MGRRGPVPEYAKREQLGRLLAEGVSLSEVARRVGVNRKTAKRWRNGRSIRYSDGRVVKLPPVITTTKTKEYSARYLSEDERIRLADLHREKRTIREIGRVMERAASTISRELRRGADARGRYHPFDAQRRALARRRIHRPSRLATDPVLREWVADRLKARWSPETIAVALQRQFPNEPERWLCAETIYQALYRPDLGVFLRELPVRVLRRRRRHRVPRRDAQRRRSGPVTGMTMIRDRDAAVLEREVGHWEGDLIMGARNATAIVTLVERVIRLTLLGYLPAGPTMRPP
jgi:transposase, IS30 family